MKTRLAVILLLICITGVAGCSGVSSAPPNTKTDTPISAPFDTTTPTPTPTPVPAPAPAAPTPTLMSKTVTNISVDEVKRKLESGASFILVDVRSKANYDQGHITGARSIPLEELGVRYTEISQPAEVVVYSACT